jgi:hypothetical protein
MIEAASSSETPVNIYQHTLRQITQEGYLKLVNGLTDRTEYEPIKTLILSFLDLFTCIALIQQT